MSKSVGNTPSNFVLFMRKPLGFRINHAIDVYMGCTMEIDGRHPMVFQHWIPKLVKSISS